MMLRLGLVVLLALGSGSVPTTSPFTQSSDAVIRVIDVGAGLCCVAKIPGPEGDHYLIYDAGNFRDDGDTAIEGIKEVIPESSTIDLMVLSHSDADHLAATKAICNDYKVARVIRPGTFGKLRSKPTQTWQRAFKAIQLEEASVPVHRGLLRQATRTLVGRTFSRVGSSGSQC
jgi:beta-lactamase superfamily II metal-dependent hydrolase